MPCVCCVQLSCVYTLHCMLVDIEGTVCSKQKPQFNSVQHEASTKFSMTDNMSIIII